MEGIFVFFKLELGEHFEEDTPQPKEGHRIVNGENSTFSTVRTLKGNKAYLFLRAYNQFSHEIGM